MRKIILSILLTLLFIQITSATIIEIGNDENNLSTFTFNFLTEKIEIKNNDATITNLIHFNIDMDSLDQRLDLLLYLPYGDGRNLSVSSFNYLACGSQLARENSIELNNPENSGWTLDCGDYDGETIRRNSLTHVSNSIYLKGVPLGDLEKKDERVGIYVQIKYTLRDYVVENEGEYKYIPIDKFQTSKSYMSLEGGHNIIFLVMPKGTILEEKSNFNLKKITESGELVLEYRSPNEDSMITIRDSIKESASNYFWFLSAIFMTFILSFLLILMDQEIGNLSKKFRGLLFVISIILFFIFFSYTSLNAGMPKIMVILINILFLFFFISFVSIIKTIKGSKNNKTPQTKT